MYNWPTNSSFSFQILLKTCKCWSFWSSLSFLPHSLFLIFYHPLISLRGNTVFPWAFHYGYQMLSTRIQFLFLFPTVLWFLWCSVQHLTHTESKQTSQVLITIPKTVRWSWIPKTPRKQFLFSFYTTVQNNQRNGLKPTSLTCAPSILSLLFPQASCKL